MRASGIPETRKDRTVGWGVREFRTPDAFAKSDDPGWIEGRVFVRWRIHRLLRGYFAWGRPTATDARALVDVFEAEAHHQVRTGACAVADLSELERIDPAAFATIANHVSRQPVAARPTREAIVRPRGLSGAVVAGFFAVVPRPEPVRVFEGLSDALSWVGGGASLAELVELRRSVRRPSDEPIVRRLRAHLAAPEPSRSIAEAARALRISVRTLQHHLHRAGTSYRQQRDRVRMERARAELAEGDRPIGAIGLELGFASPQRFSEWFRRLTGSSPSQWRAHQQRQPHE